MKNKPFASIIVPTFNEDPERLKNCLTALENQTYPKKIYEVIVVDNGSNRDIQSIVKRFSQATISKENQPGSYLARNKGISLAKGKIIAFTDSDCIPAKDWIEKGVNNLLKDSNIGLVGGRLEPIFKNPKKITTAEFYDVIMHFDQKRFVENKKFATTSNLFTFKHVFDKIGTFDAKLKSSGDVGWGQRVFAAGYKQRFAKDVIIYHPTRYTYSQLYIKNLRVAGGFYLHKNKSNPKEILTKIGSFKISNIQKFKIILLIAGLHSILMIERIRLKMGGKPRR